MATKAKDVPEEEPGSGLPGYDTDTAKTEQERLEADPALEPGLAHARDAAAREEVEPHDEDEDDEKAKKD